MTAPGLSPLAATLTLGAITSPTNPMRSAEYDAPTLTLGGVSLGPVERFTYSTSARPPNDHGATAAERAVTRGPTHNPGRLTRRERRRRAGR